MNETKTEQKPVPTRFQKLKMHMMSPVMVLMVAITAMVSNASATNVSFQGVVDVIDGIVPVFGSLKDLIIAAVPVMVTIGVISALLVFIKKIFGSSFKV